MEKDSQTVRIKSMQTLAQQRGKLTLVTFEQRTRSGEWRERKREGEKPEIRIVKEMEEELGYRIPKVERLFELYVSPATIMEKIVYFTCAYSPADKVSEGGGLPEEGEDIEVIETTLEKAAAMIAAGEIIDA